MNLIKTWLAGSELAGNSEQCHVLMFPVMHGILLHVCTQLHQVDVKNYQHSQSSLP